MPGQISGALAAIEGRAASVVVRLDMAASHDALFRRLLADRAIAADVITAEVLAEGCERERS